MKFPSRNLATLGVSVVVVAASCSPSPPTPPGPQPAVDAAIVALNIVPAGSHSPPSYADVGREARMYDSLTPLRGNVTEADLGAGFKPAGLDFPEGEAPTSIERPRSGLEIRRDQFNVPYITADSDALAIWAVGWLAADHNPFTYEAARRNGRIAAADVPNINPVAEALALNVLEPTPAADAVLVEQLNRLAGEGADGEAVLADIDSFVVGYNSRLDSILSPLPRWTRLDVVALAAFKAAWWGRGVVAPPPWGASPMTQPELDDRLVQSAMRVPTAGQSAAASNFALIGAKRSTNGHPILIGGPQVGYSYPGVAFEVVINSPSIHMRGLTAPAVPGYVFTGRGEDFAFTVNSALQETTARIALVPTCGPGVGWYQDGAQCREVESVALGSWASLGGAPTPAEPILFRTRFGAVDGYQPSATGGLVMRVVQRPSAGWDVLDMLAYRQVNVGGFDGPDGFRGALRRSPQAFYVGYVDGDHIAAFTTCWCAEDRGGDWSPVADVESLVRPLDELASTTDPLGGLITNWNEPLRSTPTGDFVPPDEGGERRDWFERFDEVGSHSAASAASAMNDVATRHVPDDARWSWFDLSPFEPGSRPASIRATYRSTAIQQIMSFGS